MAAYPFIGGLKGARTPRSSPTASRDDGLRIELLGRAGRSNSRRRLGTLVRTRGEREQCKTEERLPRPNWSFLDVAVVVIVVFVVVLPTVVVGGLFVWAAFKDGQEDRALQARLGIRRRTRLGR